MPPLTFPLAYQTEHLPSSAKPAIAILQPPPAFSLRSVTIGASVAAGALQSGYPAPNASFDLPTRPRPPKRRAPDAAADDGAGGTVEES